MCGRYCLFEEKGELAKIFGLSNNVDFKPNYNAAPSHDLPIIIKDRIGFAKWGFVPPFGDPSDTKYPKPINARAESVFDKTMFKQSMQSRRCLVPANGYYEWLETTQGGKVPFFAAGADRAVFAFAGLWSKHDDLVTFCIICREATGQLAEIHKRMPVIVPAQDREAWFSNDAKEWQRLLTQDHPYDDFQPYEVSRDVNKVANNREELIRPAGDFKA